MPSLHHEVNRIDRVSGFFICDACPFTGDIDDAIEHVVVNQFNVVEPKHDNSNSTDKAMLQLFGGKASRSVSLSEKKFRY